MAMTKKLMIDIEDKNGVIGYIAAPEDGKKVKIVLAGKSIVPVPENERHLKIYKLLEENCDVIFCTTQTLKDFNFYPIPSFAIFAVDSQGNCFGTIGGSGDIVDDDYSVGYVNHEGMCCKIADSLKDFLGLVTFYPFWRDIIRCEQMGVPYEIKTMEHEHLTNNPQCLAHQCEIATILNLTKNPKSIELLLLNIKCESELVVYCSKDEAQKKNSFYETHELFE